jgi:hypothetical protein
VCPEIMEDIHSRPGDVMRKLTIYITICCLALLVNFPVVHAQWQKLNVPMQSLYGIAASGSTVFARGISQDGQWYCVLVSIDNGETWSQKNYEQGLRDYIASKKMLVLKRLLARSRSQRAAECCRPTRRPTESYFKSIISYGVCL